MALTPALCRVYEVTDTDPASASVIVDTTRSFDVKLPNGGKNTHTLRGQLTLQGSPEIFHYNFRRTLTDESGKLLHEKVWDELIPRDLTDEGREAYRYHASVVFGKIWANVGRV